MKLPFPRRFGATLLFVLAAGLNAACSSVAPYANAGSAPEAGADAGFADGLFGRHAVEQSDTGPRARWNKVMARFAEQRRHPETFCPVERRETCAPARWEAIVAELRTLPIAERVRRADSVFNAVPYVLAATNWGDPAFWATPYEFLARNGQCTDYAIAKYLALRESGVAEQDLRFVVVHDTISNIDHAVLAVNVEGQALLLDNRLKAPAKVAELQSRYAPYYALNDLGWARFASPDTAVIAAAASGRHS